MINSLSEQLTGIDISRKAESTQFFISFSQTVLRKFNLRKNAKLDNES